MAHSSSFNDMEGANLFIPQYNSGPVDFNLGEFNSREFNLREFNPGEPDYGFSNPSPANWGQVLEFPNQGTPTPSVEPSELYKDPLLKILDPVTTASATPPPRRSHTREDLSPQSSFQPQTPPASHSPESFGAGNAQQGHREKTAAGNRKGNPTASNAGPHGNLEDKRYKNCLAASKCRKKKKEENEKTQRRIRELEEVNSTFKQDTKALAAEVIYLKTLLLTHALRCHEPDVKNWGALAATSKQMSALSPIERSNSNSLAMTYSYSNSSAATDGVNTHGGSGSPPTYQNPYSYSNSSAATDGVNTHGGSGSPPTYQNHMETGMMGSQNNTHGSLENSPMPSPYGNPMDSGMMPSLNTFRMYQGIAEPSYDHTSPRAPNQHPVQHRPGMMRSQNAMRMSRQHSNSIKAEPDFTASGTRMTGPVQGIAEPSHHYTSPCAQFQHPVQYDPGMMRSQNAMRMSRQHSNSIEADPAFTASDSRMTGPVQGIAEPSYHHTSPRAHNQHPAQRHYDVPSHEHNSPPF